MKTTEEKLLEFLANQPTTKTFVVKKHFNISDALAYLGVSKPTYYSLVKKLEAQGLVKKLENGLILVKTSGEFQPKLKSTANLEPSVSSCDNFNKLIEAGFIEETAPSAKQFLAFLKNNGFDLRLDDFIDVFLAKNKNKQLKNKYAYFIKSWQNWKSQPTQHPKSSFAPAWAEKLLETFD